MSDQKKWIVLTTINPPNAVINKLSSRIQSGWSIVVVGDKKTPADWSYEGIVYLSPQLQGKMFKEFSDLIPFNHYSRKNLGYLYAIQNGAELILETDDDNIPYDNFGSEITSLVEGLTVENQGWVNVYRHFSHEKIWPRGLPLDQIDSLPKLSVSEKNKICLIQQYLADEDPDVDAIHRFLFKSHTYFKKSPPVILEKGAWSPFNSQNTVFFKEAFPLMYLPCHVSFRMTDIWRSFVAQASLWTANGVISVHGATVKQARNPHDLMKDFEEEIPGYLGNGKIVRLLGEAMKANEEKSVVGSAEIFWKILAGAGFIDERELAVLTAWFNFF